MNRRRFWQVPALLLAIAIISSGILTPAVDAAIPWATWVPTTYTSLGWENPSDARVTGRISNLLFTYESGNANDTIMYSELLVDPSNNTVLANYIDFEEATGASFASNPFDEAIPQAAKAGLHAVIAQHTDEHFTGTTLWELVKFTFTELWNALLPGSFVTTDIVDLGVHEGVLLDYGGIAGLGHVCFVNLGTKAAIMFDVGLNSSWGVTSTFTSSVQAFVAAFIAPLAEILHVASIDQMAIIASNAISPASSPIQPAQSTSFLSRSSFLSLAGVLIETFPLPSFPYILQWNQIAIIIVLIVAIALIIYYGLVSYSKEKKKVPESQPREQAWYK